MTSPIPDGRPASMPTFNSSERDLVRVVGDACRQDPDVPALIFEDGVSVTRARLWAEVTSFAGYLSTRIAPGDRVAVMMPNRAEFMVTWLAVAACRGILVALNPAARSHDAGHVLRVRLRGSTRASTISTNRFTAITTNPSTRITPCTVG